MSGTKLGMGEQDVIMWRRQRAAKTVIYMCTGYIERLSVLPGGGTRERIN